MRFLNRAGNLILIFFILNTLSACALFRKSVLNYSETKLPDSQIKYDLSYWNSSEADPVKNRLDLFIPKQENWPLLIFVHGGEWISGDKSLKVLGADIYRNIGRFFATHGVGVAVINYRLMPHVDWKTQTLDVARAVNWLHQNIQKYKGNPKQIFLMGHSSGAQLAVRVALDPKPLGSLGSSPQILCGIIPVSGAGYDLTDEDTYALAQKEHLFEKLFQTGSIPQSLRRQMSPIRYVNSKAPPFLILYSEKEEKELQKESLHLHQKLSEAGVKTQVIETTGDHKTVVLTLSNSKTIPTSSILVFIETLTCS